jgi:hypothetical protein
MSAHSPRVTAARDFLENTKMFLNLETQKPVSPGDIILWTPAHGQFERVTTLSDLGLTLETHTSAVTGELFYNSAAGVAVHFEEKGPSGWPTMHFNYTGSGRYSVQVHDATLESLDEIHLAAHITKHAASVWERDWIVVTAVWKAAACTLLISGTRGARVGICASTKELAGPFNIADISLKCSVGYGDGMHSEEIARQGACPFFIGMKYHAPAHHQPHMVHFQG